MQCTLYAVHEIYNTYDTMYFFFVWKITTQTEVYR